MYVSCCVEKNQNKYYTTIQVNIVEFIPSQYATDRKGNSYVVSGQVRMYVIGSPDVYVVNDFLYNDYLHFFEPEMKRLYTNNTCMIGEYFVNLGDRFAKIYTPKKEED